MESLGNSSLCFLFTFFFLSSTLAKIFHTLNTTGCLALRQMADAWRLHIFRSDALASVFALKLCFLSRKILITENEWYELIFRELSYDFDGNTNFLIRSGQIYDKSESPACRQTRNAHFELVYVMPLRRSAARETIRELWSNQPNNFTSWSFLFRTSIWSVLYCACSQ